MPSSHMTLLSFFFFCKFWLDSKLFQGKNGFLELFKSMPLCGCWQNMKLDIFFFKRLQVPSHCENTFYWPYLFPLQKKKIDLVTPLMEPVLIFSKRHVVGTGVEQHFKMEANILSCSFAITQPTEDQKKRFQKLDAMKREIRSLGLQYREQL